MSILVVTRDDRFPTSFFFVQKHVCDFLPFLDNECKSCDHRGFWTPNLVIPSRAPYSFGYAACWRISQFWFFCSECILWAVRWYGGIRSFLSSHRVHFLLFARSWSLFNSSPVWTTIEIFNYFPTKKLKITTTGRFLQSSDSKPDALSVWLLGLLRAFPILFSCIQWLRWIVKWHSMLPVVSLLPSVTIWMMIVSWLHFFRLEPGLASTSFWQWIWKLPPQRGSNTQWSVSKSDALYGTLFDLARWFRFRFFIVNDYEEV